MPESHFSFITNDSLRHNIDATFSHIAELLTIVNDPQYSSEAKSAFCKTIIIHTGAVIEALLFALLDARYSDKDIQSHYSSWKLKPFEELHQVEKKQRLLPARINWSHQKPQKQS